MILNRNIEKKKRDRRRQKIWGENQNPQAHNNKEAFTEKEKFHTNYSFHSINAPFQF